MNTYKEVGTFEPDSLFASNEFPVLKEAAKLAAGSGVLKRGTLIMKGSDGKWYPAGKTVADVTMKPFGVLTDDTDTGADDSAAPVPAICYITGIFNASALILAAGAITDHRDDLRSNGIYLRKVVEQ